MASNKAKGILCVIGGLILHIVFGCLYLWGNIQVYVTSYLYKYDTSITLDDTSTVFILQNAFKVICVPLATFLIDFIPPWSTSLIGGVISMGGVFASTYATNLYLFIFLYPILFGIGTGFCYMIPIMCGWEYFPEWKGTVSGIILSGYGCGSFIFSFISIGIANPDEEQADYPIPGGNIFNPESPVSSRAPAMLRIICAIWCCFIIAGMFLVSRKTNPALVQPLPKTSRLHTRQDFFQNETINSHLSIPGASITVEPELSEVFKEYRVYYIWLMLIFSSSYPLYLAGSFKTFEQIDLHDDRFITLVGSLGAIANGLSRWFWATLQDFFGFKKIFALLMIFEIIVAFTFVSIHRIKILYLIWVFISFSSLGGYASTAPTLCAKIYGPISGGKTYTIIFSAYAVSPMIGWGLSKMKTKGVLEYSTLFYILGIMPIISLIMTIFLNDSTMVKNASCLNIKNEQNMRKGLLK
ncbi:unnamed protein product [Moneuplotes crassus]|uniref:Uncharacterized protein n=1 Tax=Euplotes crassus TaxID=5936 RepID=A0AAD1XEC0_EUPCR|nr:unnamed protein product [Moneuplotes crassus]